MASVVVAARPGQEQRAATHSKRQYGRDSVYQPVFYDYKRKVRRPLFGRYFFVDIGRDRSKWGAIKSTRGVLYVITNNGEYSFIPDREIARLRSLENDNGVIELPRKNDLSLLDAAEYDDYFGKYGRKPEPISEKSFEAGQQVRIIGGAYNGEIGIYEGMTIKQCEAVLLGWLGRALVPLSQLEAA